MRKKFLAGLVLASTLIHSGETTLAAIRTWTNAAGGIFDAPGNWSGGAVPGVADDAVFNILGSHTVEFTALHATAQLDVLGANVVFDLLGDFYTVIGPATIDDSFGNFGLAGSRGLEVLNGDLFVGSPGSPLRVGGPIFGNAELIIGAGGSVDANGQLEVGGSNNISGGSSVTVSDGGKLIASQLAFIGGTTGQTTASGTVNVSGTGTQFTALSFVTVGGAGTGVLNIDEGASLFSLPLNVPNTTATGVIADEAGSTGTVNVSLGATWTDSLGIDVGRGGSGTLNILSAGEVTSPTSTVARLPGSTGSVTIDGANSLWEISGDLTIGGTAATTGGVGTVDVTNSGRLFASPGGSIRVRSGSQLRGNNFSIIAAGIINIDAGARLSGTSSIAGSVGNSGTVAPGLSPGIMNISGDYTQTSEGLLEIEVEGLDPGFGHDKLIISGNTTLAGRLDVPVTAAPGFPVAGDEITFLTGFGGVMGAFDIVTSPNIATQAPGLALQVNYFPNDVRLKFVAPTTNTFLGVGGNWFTAGLWSGDVPDSTSSVILNNTTTAPLTVTVSVPPRDAVVHDITIAGNTDSMTLSVKGGSTFFANSSVVVGNNGVLDIAAGGAVTTHSLHVNGGGLVSGNGTINSNTVLGIAGGTDSATLSPGIAIGKIEQNGNLQILSNGVVEVELARENGNSAGSKYDIVNVSGEITYGGTLVIDTANYVANAPTTTSLPRFDIITSDSRAAGTVFEKVVVTNAPANLGFDVVYSDGTGPVMNGAVSDSAILAAAGGGSGSVATVVGSFLGDMDWDGQLDMEDDVAAFVLGLTDPFRYFTEIEDINHDHHAPSVLGDTGGSGGENDLPDGTLDFDDVDSFIRKFPRSSPAEVLELIEIELTNIVLSGIALDVSTQQLARIHEGSAHVFDLLEYGVLVPEPATVWLILVGGVFLSTHRARYNYDAIGTAG